MGYREASLRRPLPAIVLAGIRYDVDCFGMDDGKDDSPDAAFRFLFQLGRGYMIYLYVIQAGGRTRPAHFSHSFWVKDCAVADVEMEEFGPPSSVKAEEMVLPLLYGRAVLHGPEGQRALVLAAQRFRASDERGIEMRIELASPGGCLRWTRASGWEVELGDADRRALAAEEWLTFDGEEG